MDHRLTIGQWYVAESGFRRRLYVSFASLKVYLVHNWDQRHESYSYRSPSVDAHGCPICDRSPVYLQPSQESRFHDFLRSTSASTAIAYPAFILKIQCHTQCIPYSRVRLITRVYSIGACSLGRTPAASIRGLCRREPASAFPA